MRSTEGKEGNQELRGLRSLLVAPAMAGSSDRWVNLNAYIATGGTIQAEDMLQNAHNFYRLLVVP
jgi:hypothetical protein